MKAQDLEKQNIIQANKSPTRCWWFFLYAKDRYKVKYQLLINERENPALKNLNDSKPFIEYWNDTDDIYKNIEEYNSSKKIAFRGKRLNIYIVFIAQFCIAVPKILH